MGTALVTGASTGIGRAFATALAARGDDVIVVARDTARLDQLAAQLRNRHGVEVEVLSADLGIASGVASVEDRLRDDRRPVGLLVNNAGFGTFGKFHELPLEKELEEINLNVVALVRLCRAAIPGMVARGRGGVVNVSSLAGFQPNPHNATYGGTKAYVVSFSQAIHEELRGTGVHVTVVCPGATRTEFQERAGMDSRSIPGFLWMTAEGVAHAALRANERGRAVCVPGALNRASAILSDSLPQSLTRRMAAVVVKRIQ
jgi:short-subunit dehydrogenase